MLISLNVHNYAIIENLEIEFLDGFNIITGETGAGKSILIGALGLVLGKRADTKVLFDLGKKCTVEAHFDIAEYQLQEYFAAHDLDYDKELYIRREIAPSGKSRAFINDTPTNLTVLRTLSNQLLDMHQQFDTLGLNTPEVQLDLLDAYAQNSKTLETYSALFQQYSDTKNTLNRLVKQKLQAEKDQELLNYQLQEFEALSLEKGQLATWEEELTLLENAELIKSTLSQSAYSISDAEPSVLSSLEDIKFELNKVSSFHPDIENLYETFFEVIENLRATSESFQDQADKTDLDPERLQIIQQKLDQVYLLQSKHKIQTEEELMDKWHYIIEQVNAYNNSEEDIRKTEMLLKEITDKLDLKAKELSANRKKAIDPFCKAIESNLHNLSMKYAKFQIELNDLPEFSESGKDEIAFLFAANVGARLQELNEVASGGELSRLSLCIKSELAKTTALPTLIFDEIDSGVSGAISMQMGKMIQKLSKSHQIINITHSPQIASKADRHYKIYKENNKDRSFTKMEILDFENRLLEIATMLSGDPPSPAAIENAKTLLEA